MKIFFIVDDTIFFLPSYLEGVLKCMDSKDKIIGVGILSSTSKNTIYSYIVKTLKHIPLMQLIKLVMVFSILSLKRVFFLLKISKNPITISQVAKYYFVPIYRIRNVNDSNFPRILKELNVDIIISSCSSIFKKEILELPRIACINRHSALLPSYGGLFPIFQAMIHGEKEVGVTIHNMTEKIDEGKIISQRLIPITDDDSLFSLYEKSYKESIQATIDAVEILEKKLKPKIERQTKKSYFSYPKDEDWKIFFDQKNTFI